MTKVKEVRRLRPLTKEDEERLKRIKEGKDEIEERRKKCNELAIANDISERALQCKQHQN